MRQVNRERVVQHVKVRIYPSCHRSTATQRADVVHVLHLVASIVDKRFIEQHHTLMPLQHHVRLLRVVRPAHHAPQLRTPVENPLGRDEVLPLTPPVFEHVRWDVVLDGQADVLLVTLQQGIHGARRDLEASERQEEEEHKPLDARRNVITQGRVFLGEEEGRDDDGGIFTVQNVPRESHDGVVQVD